MRGIDDRVVTLAPQIPEKPHEPQRMAKRVGLLERHDPQAGEPFRHGGAAPSDQKVHSRAWERISQSESERYGQERVADAIVGPHHENATQLVRARRLASQWEDDRSEPREQPRQKARRRVEARVVRHASTASQ